MRARSMRADARESPQRREFAARRGAVATQLRVMRSRRRRAPAGATRARLQRACESSSSRFPAPRRPDTRKLRSEVPTASQAGAENTPNIAKYRSFQRFASLSDGPPLSSCGARQLAPQAVESTAISRFAAGAASRAQTRARGAAPASRARPRGSSRAAALRAVARPLPPARCDLASGVAAILTVASADHRRGRRIRGTPPNFAAPRSARNRAPCFGQSAAGAGLHATCGGGPPAAAGASSITRDALGRPKANSAVVRAEVRAHAAEGDLVTLPSRSIDGGLQQLAGRRIAAHAQLLVGRVARAAPARARPSRPSSARAVTAKSRRISPSPSRNWIAAPERKPSPDRQLLRPPGAPGRRSTATARRSRPGSARAPRRPSASCRASRRRRCRATVAAAPAAAERHRARGLHEIGAQVAHRFVAASGSRRRRA